MEERQAERRFGRTKGVEWKKGEGLDGLAHASHASPPRAKKRASTAHAGLITAPLTLSTIKK